MSPSSQELPSSLPSSPSSYVLHRELEYFFDVLLACALEPISAPKMTTFTTVQPLGCEKVSLESNPIP